MTNRTRRTRARRWADGACVGLWACAVVAVVACAVVGVARAASRQMPVPAVREVALERGGTLWGVAVRCAAAGQDPRAVAEEIRRMNGIRRGQVLHPGSRLRVPDYRAGATCLARNTQ